MGNNWILDVLADLNAFAKANGLNSLALQLDEAERVARQELESQAEGNSIGIHLGNAAAGRPARTIGASRNTN